MPETCSDHRERSLLRWNGWRSKTDGTQQVEVKLGGEITDLLREFWAAAEQANNAQTQTLGEDDEEESRSDEEEVGVRGENV